VAVNPILVASLVYGFDAVLGLLLLGASFMAYHVSKQVGHFRAWIFLMVAILLIALDQFISMSSLVFLSPAEIESALLHHRRAACIARLSAESMECG
jgi:hypothetical protein